MYLRITRWHIPPATYEQVVPLAREAITVLHRLPGVQAVYQGIDQSTGHGAIVSIWDSEEHAGFSRDAVLGELIERIRAAGVQFDPPELYPVEEATR